MIDEPLGMALADILRSVGVDVREEGDTVTALGHTLQCRGRVVQVIEQDGDTIAAIDTAMLLDGRAVGAFHLASVARDSTRAEAIAHAVREWAVSTVVPLVPALRALAPEAGTPETALRAGRYAVFAGPTARRGEMLDPDASFGSSALHETILSALEPALEQWFEPARDERLHSMRFTLHVRSGFAGEGDCMVDGVPSSGLCDALRGLTWPGRGEAAQEYVVKQLYFLVRSGR